MNVVLDFRRRYEQRFAPPLVFVDLQEDLPGANGILEDDRAAAAIGNCRKLLAHARAGGWPVAFVRKVRAWRKGNLTGAPRWISGFEPRRADMLFDRDASSCYASTEFADAMDAAGGAFVIAGVSGDDACLSTFVDAARYGHQVGLISDAVVSQPLPGFGPEESHRAIIALASRHAAVVTAQSWIEAAADTRGAMEVFRAVAAPR